MSHLPDSERRWTCLHRNEIKRKKTLNWTQFLRLSLSLISDSISVANCHDIFDIFFQHYVGDSLSLDWTFAVETKFEIFQFHLSVSYEWNDQKKRRSANFQSTMLRPIALFCVIYGILFAPIPFTANPSKIEKLKNSSGHDNLPTHRRGFGKALNNDVELSIEIMQWNRR